MRRTAALVLALFTVALAATPVIASAAPGPMTTCSSSVSCL